MTGTRHQKRRPWQAPAACALACVVVLALVCGLFAPAVQARRPHGALHDELDEYLAQNVPATGVPGIAVAVVSSDGTEYQRTFGDCPGPDAAFTIGSLSKSFTALCIMQLVERGEVDLDDPASDYVPDYLVPEEVTVRSLLNQTSGFGYYESLSQAQVGDTFGSFSYANANYDLLGRIVESVSGLDYDEYLRENVFEPLGMTSASTQGSAVKSPKVDPGHRNYFGINVADGFSHEVSDDAWGADPSGYVQASVSDMARYLQMYLDKGEGILSPAGIEAMVTDKVPDPYGSTFYGMGWTTYYDDGDNLVMSHDGQVENYVARMTIVPSSDVAVVVLGDSNDYFGGNSCFFDLASGVVDIATGTPALYDVDPSDRVSQHLGLDIAYLALVLSSAVPLFSLGSWRRRLISALEQDRPLWPRVALAILVHLALPMFLLDLPRQLGYQWRDLSMFVPDLALVLVAVAAILFAGGCVKVVVWALAARAESPGDTFERCARAAAHKAGGGA